MYASNSHMKKKGNRETLHLPSPKEIARAMTPAGGWTKKQLAKWGVPWPPSKGWKRYLEEEWRKQQLEQTLLS